jgi:hypothetical protein
VPPRLDWTDNHRQINEKERYAMNVALESPPERTEGFDGGPASDPVTEGRLWCPVVLPNGTQGHWFFVDEGSPFICIDPACPLHGQVVYQCPLHRGFLGRNQGACSAANCGKRTGIWRCPGEPGAGTAK